MSDDRFLIDSILPAYQTHIITGPSGAGTTTLGLQMLDAFRLGEDVLGYPSHPAPFCYVSCNLPLSVLRAQMRQLDIPTVGSIFPHFSLVGDHSGPDKRTFHNVYTLACHRVPNLALLFIDSLSSLCPGRITDDRVVDDFIDAMNTVCQTDNVTILGTIRSSKARTGEGYLSPRERIIGSGAFSSATSTKFIIEPTKPSKPDDPNRTLWTLPRVGKPVCQLYAFNDDGRLERQSDYVPQAPLDAWLLTVASGAEIHSDEMLIVADSCGVARTQLYDWVKVQIELGTLLRIARGEYKKAENQ